MTNLDLALDAVRPSVLIDGVEYTYPQYSKGKVNRAAVLLAWISNWDQLDLFHDIEEARKVVNNWRSAHSYPLQAIKMGLKHKAQAVDESAIVAQRLKRAEAIKAKMIRQSKKHGRMFDLTSMQDLGGCRAIMRDVEKVEELLAAYEESHRKNPDRGSPRESIDDYISVPKEDGYRGIHLIYRYRSQTHEKDSLPDSTIDRLKFEGLRIEIQIRSVLQHQWASAVETAGRYIKRNIKGGGGGAEWDQFFRLTSSAIAMVENRPLVPGTPSEKADLVKEIKQHKEQIARLKTYIAPRLAVEGITKGEMFVLIVDSENKTFEARPFRRRKIQDAQEEYFSTEKEIQLDESVDAVLVGVDSGEQLSVAYPSYFLDARDFVKTIQKFIA